MLCMYVSLEGVCLAGEGRRRAGWRAASREIRTEGKEDRSELEGGLERTGGERKKEREKGLMDFHFLLYCEIGG